MFDNFSIPKQGKRLKKSTPRCKIEQMSVKKITIVNSSIPRCKIEHKKVTFDFSQKQSLLLLNKCQIKQNYNQNKKSSLFQYSEMLYWTNVRLRNTLNKIIILNFSIPKQGKD